MLKDLIARLFGAGQAQGDSDLGRAQASLKAHSLTARLTLAAETGVDADVLDFLSKDDDTDVRILVAANAEASWNANARLAQDPIATVREELARKVARIAPSLSAAENAQAVRNAIEIMEILADDIAVSVRAILSEELKASAAAPHHIILRLARDLDDAVAAPVLEHSPLLNDYDLLEILACTGSARTVQAISRRNRLPTSVAEAVMETGDEAAVEALLKNASIAFQPETLDRVAGRAAGHQAWHRPLVGRPELSVRAVRRLAEFVSANLLEALERRSGLDPALKAHLRSRLNDKLRADAAALGQVRDEAKAAARVNEALARGAVDQDFVMDLVEEGARAALVHALAACSGIRPQVVERIFAARSGKAIAAVVWKAGFSARLALKVQTLIAHVPGAQTVLPRQDGAYPIGPEDMILQLEFFGALKA
jgi:uncharacterized protein (DUF2336 family)